VLINENNVNIGFSEEESVQSDDEMYLKPHYERYNDISDYDIPFAIENFK
jgi:hypothetical protein